MAKPTYFLTNCAIALVGFFIDCVKFTSLQCSLRIFTQYFLRAITILFAQSNFMRLEFF